ACPRGALRLVHGVLLQVWNTIAVCAPAPCRRQGRMVISASLNEALRDYLLPRQQTDRTTRHESTRLSKNRHNFACFRLVAASLWEAHLSRAPRLLMAERRRNFYGRQTRLPKTRQA